MKRNPNTWADGAKLADGTYPARSVAVTVPVPFLVIWTNKPLPRDPEPWTANDAPADFYVLVSALSIEVIAPGYIVAAGQRIDHIMDKAGLEFAWRNSIDSEEWHRQAERFAVARDREERHDTPNPKPETPDPMHA